MTNIINECDESTESVSRAFVLLLFIRATIVWVGRMGNWGENYNNN